MFLTWLLLLLCNNNVEAVLNYIFFENVKCVETLNSG